MLKNKILIIDDDVITRKALEIALVNEGYEVHIAGNGTEGLDKTGEISPDLLLLDVMMPDIDGYEVCQRIREEPNIAEIPIVMITTLDDLDSRLKGLESGADDFILKPINHIELVAKVRTITRLNRYRRLVAERSRLEWVVEQSDEGYLVINQQDQILYANSKAQVYLGLNKDYKQPPFLSFLNTIKNKYNCEPKENWANWSHENTNEQYCERYLVLPETDTSNAIWLQVTSLEQAAGPEIQHLIRLQDVTQSLTSQRDIMTFHRTLNHKLRTPLSSLKISVEILADERVELPRDEAINIAKTARQSVNRLKNDLQDITRFLEAPQLPNAGSVSCVKEASSIISDIQKTLAIHSIEISIDDNINTVTVPLSSKELELIFWELLENAKKFHPRNDPSIEVKIQKSNGSLLFQIMDDGSELTPDQINKVWLPYYQGEKYFTGEISGMGLGLSLVSTLVWQKGGTCTMYNRSPDPGITVEISLPPPSDSVKIMQS